VSTRKIGEQTVNMESEKEKRQRIVTKNRDKMCIQDFCEIDQLMNGKSIVSHNTFLWVKSTQPLSGQKILDGLYHEYDCTTDLQSTVT